MVWWDLISTVVGLSALALSMLFRVKTPAALPVSKVKATSSAVSGVPSENFTSSRMVTVHVFIGR